MFTIGASRQVAVDGLFRFTFYRISRRRRGGHALDKTRRIARTFDYALESRQASEIGRKTAPGARPEFEIRAIDAIKSQLHRNEIERHGTRLTQQIHAEPAVQIDSLLDRLLGVDRRWSECRLKP